MGGDAQLGIFEEMQPAGKAWLGRVFLLVFVCIANVLLLNLLIAMMSKTYEAVQERAEEQFYYVKAKMIYFYDQQRMSLPVPLNLVAGVLELLLEVAHVVRRAARWCCCLGGGANSAAVAPTATGAARGKGAARAPSGVSSSGGGGGVGGGVGGGGGGGGSKSEWWCKFCFFANDSQHTTIFCVACGRFAVPMRARQVRQAKVALCVSGTLFCALALPVYLAVAAYFVAQAFLQATWRGMACIAGGAFGLFDERGAEAGSSGGGEVPGAAGGTLRHQSAGGSLAPSPKPRKRMLPPAISHALFHLTTQGGGEGGGEGEGEGKAGLPPTPSLATTGEPLVPNVPGCTAAPLKIPLVHEWLLKTKFEDVLGTLAGV